MENYPEKGLWRGTGTHTPPPLESLPRQVPREDILALPCHCGSLRTSASARYKGKETQPSPESMATHSLVWKSSGFLSEPPDLVAESHAPSSGERRAEMHSVSCVACPVLPCSSWAGWSNTRRPALWPLPGFVHGTGDLETGWRKPLGGEGCCFQELGFRLPRT